MSEAARYQLWIAAAGCVIFFTTLGGAGLWDMDEALYSSCAREMLQRGNWIVPWFNGQMFPEKPPLMFWSMMAGFELFGYNEFGARFFSAVFGVAAALVAFHLGRILANARVGLWAGLITASTLIYTISARAATVDSALTLATTAAFFFFVLGLRDGEQGRGRLKLRWAAPLYACVGAAVLAKGPVGMVLPLAAMGLYLLVAEGWRNWFRSAWWMRPLTAVVVVGAVALPWYLAVGIQTEGEWLRRFFLEFNLRPFQQPILGHGDTSTMDKLLGVLISFSYYFYQIPAVLVGFFPWSVFLGPTIADTIQRIRRRDAWRDGCILALCWFGVWFVFWSICKTKLPHYLLPAYPALALLTAMFVDRWQTAPTSLKPWWLRNAWISLVLVGVGILIAIPIVAAQYLPGEAWIGTVGLILVAGGVWCWWKTSCGQHRQAAVAFTITAVAFLTAAFGLAALGVDRHQNGKPMIAAIRADWNKSSPGDSEATITPAPHARIPIATYRFFRESTVCYAGHPVERCEDDLAANRPAQDALKEFFSRNSHGYVITTDRHASDLQQQFPGQFSILFRQPRFLGPGEMVVLKR